MVEPAELVVVTGPAAADEPAEGAAAPPAVAVRKLELMHDWMQLLYCWVSAWVPLPWGHLAAHWLVMTTWELFGDGSPSQAAWQLTSPALQLARHLAMGLSEGVAVAVATEAAEAAEDAEEAELASTEDTTEATEADDADAACGTAKTGATAKRPATATEVKRMVAELFE